MAGRVGSRLDRGLGLASVERPLKTGKAGLYGGRGGRGASTGGANYPSVLEAYNRDSDYKRWLAGKRLFQGSGSSWSDVELSYLVYTFRDFGNVANGQRNVFTLFPSQSSPEGSWTVVNRYRGAVILPRAIEPQQLTLDQTLGPDRHRLILDVSSRLSSSQLSEWESLVGDQFEDSAIETASGVRLLDSSDGVVALTQVEVDLQGMKLVFDLSRPFMRARINPYYDYGYWKPVSYNPDAPVRWRADGSRLLCSSHRLYCSCPDFSGTRTANILGGASGSQELFPTTGRGEESLLGYRARWRDLPRRADQRRECKHIHAVRWSLGYPFYEPSDYPVGDEQRQFFGDASPSLGEEALFRYQARRQIQLDQTVIPLAASNGVVVDTRNIIPADEAVPPRPDRQSILWTSLREPPAERARIDDWWYKRGTNELLVFDPSVQRFVDASRRTQERPPVVELWPGVKPTPSKALVFATAVVAQASAPAARAAVGAAALASPVVVVATAPAPAVATGAAVIVVSPAVSASAPNPTVATGVAVVANVPTVVATAPAPEVVIDGPSYWSDWVAQNYGWESLFLIEWWGS
jgi:hypothetical protein